MQRPCRTAVLGIGLMILLPRVVQGQAGQTTQEKACCFANPSYAGVCRVVPGKDETCEKILAYLNNPASAGKTYCRSTEIRRGWKPVACDKRTRTLSCFDKAEIRARNKGAR